MVLLRSRLRSLAATWLVLQVALLAALVPQNCCDAHVPAEDRCHEAARQCPMRSADGTPCPMHRAPEAADCVMTGGCDGPASALATLLSNHGILPDRIGAVPAIDTFRGLPPTDVSAAGRFEPPDSPPPRA